MRASEVTHSDFSFFVLFVSDVQYSTDSKKDLEFYSVRVRKGYFVQNQLFLVAKHDFNMQ